MNGPIRGVLVDLDDTLYPQADFLDAAWRAVADAGADRGLDRAALLAALRGEAAAGSARGGIIDRAVAHSGGEPAVVPALVAAFHAVDPPLLVPYPGVPEALALLRARVPVALVTDGEVTGQERKLAALGLGWVFDVVVFSDRMGREHRKPHPRPFETALRLLNVAARDAVMVGDRPDKDVAGAVALGMRAVRVKTGEYADLGDRQGTWLRCADFATAVRQLLPFLPAERSARGHEPARAATLA